MKLTKLRFAKAIALALTPFVFADELISAIWVAIKNTAEHVRDTWQV